MQKPVDWILCILLLQFNKSYVVFPLCSWTSGSNTVEPEAAYGLFQLLLLLSTAEEGSIACVSSLT